MAVCSLCGKPAGWFTSQHEECATKREKGLSQISAVAVNFILGKITLQEMASLIKEVVATSFIQEKDLPPALALGWEAAAYHFVDDGNLSQEEEKKLLAFAEYARLTPDVLNNKGTYTRMRMAVVLRDVLEGRLPVNRKDLPSTRQLNFQRNEALIWAIEGVEYYEDRTRFDYEGRSQGVSFRVMKGVYYRFGAYKGHPVEREERVHVDSGILAVTTKHLYFAGPKKSVRIPHEKIISLTPYSDGVAVHRDAASAKPQIFVTGDGWFLHNLLANARNVNVIDLSAGVGSVPRGFLGTPKRW